MANSNPKPKPKTTTALTTKAAELMTAWNDQLAPNFDSFFAGKPELKQRFVDCIQRLALVSPDVVKKYTPLQLSKPLLTAAEWGLVPDNHECAIVEISGAPACWLMAGGARKLILEVPGVKYYAVECVYENETIIYDKLSNTLPVVQMKPGVDYFDKGELRGAIAFVEFDDRRVVLVEVAKTDAQKYIKTSGYHYSKEWPAQHLENICAKMLYKKLPKPDAMPRHIWDASDMGEVHATHQTRAAIVDDTPATDADADEGNATQTPAADTAQPATAADADAGDKEQTLKDV